MSNNRHHRPESTNYSSEEEGQILDTRRRDAAYKSRTRGNDVIDDQYDRYRSDQVTSSSGYRSSDGHRYRGKESSTHSSGYYSRRRDYDDDDFRNGNVQSDRYESTHSRKNSSKRIHDYTSDRYEDQGDRYGKTDRYNYDQKYTSSSKHRIRDSGSRSRPLNDDRYDYERPTTSKSKSRSPGERSDLRSIINRKSRKRDREDVIREEEHFSDFCKDKSGEKSGDKSGEKTGDNPREKSSKRLAATIEVEEVEMSDEELRPEDDDHYHRLIKGEDGTKSDESRNKEESRTKEESSRSKERIPSGEDAIDSREARPGLHSQDDSPNKSRGNTPDKSRGNTPDKSRGNTPDKSRDKSCNSPRKSSDERVASQSKENEAEEEVSEEPIPYYPSFQGCRSVDEFLCMNRIEEGTYGVVYRAKCKVTSEIVALKRLKMEKEKEGFPITSLREINTLLKSRHENIVGVKEIVVGSNMDKIFIVMEYVEHDLKSLMESMKTPFLIGEVKTLLKQLLSAIAHLHDNWILHRDLKTSNLLLNHKGILKVGDFGLAREYGSPLKPYTPVVVTLWYRAPELLLESTKYSTAIDVWSIGCIFGELVTMKPFFQGKSELNQLELIFKDLGTPNDEIWPGYTAFPLVKKIALPAVTYRFLHQRFKKDQLSSSGLDLLNRFLTYSPEKRITALSALNHSFFDESPRPVDPSMFPSWPAKSEGGQHSIIKRNHSPKAPLGGQVADSVAGENDEVLMEGFHFKGGLDDRGNIKGAGFSLKF